ncbi:hypothetical protein [Sphingomonas prati]|nr:hypothetical protein [Sphingomonas prati]
MDRRPIMVAGVVLPRASKPVARHTVMDNARYQRGLEQLEAVSGPHGAKGVQSLEGIAPDLGR